MDVETALEFVDDLVFEKTGEHLDNLTTDIFKEAWQDKSFSKMDIYNKYSESYLKASAVKLWKLLSEVLEEKIGKRNFRRAIERKWQEKRKSDSILPYNTVVSNKQDTYATEYDPNFIGREEEIAHLNNLIKKGSRAIQIVACGGQGKTMLARKFLESIVGSKVLEFRIAKNPENTVSVEKLLNENFILKLGDKPCENLMITLERLRLTLRAEEWGILIDDLENILDSSGKFIEPHRSYVDLLRMLTDTTIKSITLITSRERLCEDLDITTYSLPPLEKSAWETYWYRYNPKININNPIFTEIYKEYNGNALSMKIICNRISDDFDGEMEAYWQENKTQDGLMLDEVITNLINSELDRLEKNHLTAYTLIERMRFYQENIPEGLLLELISDIPQHQRKKTLRDLRRTYLVDCNNDAEYFLRSDVQNVLMNRARNSRDIDIEKKVKETEKMQNMSLENLSPILRNDIFEVFDYYVQKEDYKKAYEIISAKIYPSSNSTNYLYKYLRYWGYSETLIKCFEILQEKLDESQNKMLIASIGVCYYYLNDYQKAIDCFEEIEDFLRDNEDIKYRRLYPELLDYLSRSSHNLGDSKKAIEYCEEGLNFYHQKEFENNLEEKFLEYVKSVKSDLNQCLSSIYWELGDYEKTLNYANNALEIADETMKREKALEIADETMKREKALEIADETMKREIANAKATKSIALYGLEKYDEAIKEMQEAISIFKEVKDFFSEGYAHLYQSQFYLKTDINKSKKHLDIAEYIYKQGCKNIMIEAIFYEVQAEYFREKNKYVEAIEYHEKGIKLLEDKSIKPDLAESYFQLGLTYQKMGDQVNAQEYFNKALYLWSPEQIDAPKQIERVKKAMNGEH